MSGGTSPVVTGEFYGWLKVGSEYAAPFSTIAFSSTFTVSVSATGTPNWVAGAFDTIDPKDESSLGWDVAETKGVVYVGGRAETGTTFATTTLNTVGRDDAFLAAYDKSTGGLLWVKHWGVALDDGKVQQVLAEPSGDVVIAGTAPNGTDFGGGAITSGGYMDHLFVARVTPGGDMTAFNSIYVGVGSAFGLDRLPDGRIVLFGNFLAPLTLAGKSLVSGPYSDPFLAVLSQDLKQFEYAESFSTPGDDFFPGDLAVSPVDGSIAIGINFLDSITVRCQTFVGTSSWNGLVMVLDQPKE
jgi:hypothetical protein